MAGQTGHLPQECGNFVEAISAIHFRFIASLKLPFKFYPEDRAARTTLFGRRRRPADAWCEQAGDKRGVL
jgi:hypothetical protein